MNEIKNKVIEEIKKIFDPEIPVNIYELGLIYKIEIDEKNKVNVDMTLTSPNCPVAESLPKQVKDIIMNVIRNCKNQIVLTSNNEKDVSKDIKKEIFNAFDTDENGELILPEYLRKWSSWARIGREFKSLY